MNILTKLKLLILSIGYLLLAIYGPVQSLAGEDIMKKYYNYLPKEIVALPEKVRSSSLPMAYLMLPYNVDKESSQFLCGSLLNILMYPGIENYEAAVRSFQKDLGDTVTGRLTIGQMYQLNYRAEMQGANPPSLSKDYGSLITETSARVRGTLHLLDEKAAYPVNRIRINCDKNEGYCTLDEVDVQFPRQDDWSQNFHVFWVDTGMYKISKWSEDVIEADFITENPNPCRLTSLELNFKTKEYFMISKNGTQECEMLGTKMGKLSKPRISQVVEGDDIIQAEEAAYKEKQFALLSSEYRAKVEAIMKKEQASSKPTTQNSSK